MKREDLKEHWFMAYVLDEQGDIENVGNPIEVYGCKEADSVMDAYEKRIKELDEATCKDCPKLKELERMNANINNRCIKMEGVMRLLQEENARLKAQVPKWISVKDRLPSNQERVFGLVVGTDLVTKDWTPELNERINRTELCYYVDGDGWYSSEGYQMVVSPRMWMPLPPPPTTEEK